MFESIVVVRTRPRAMPPTIITMRISIHGFPFRFLFGYGDPLDGPSGRRSFASKHHSRFVWLNRIRVDHVPAQRFEIRITELNISSGNHLRVSLPSPQLRSVNPPNTKFSFLTMDMVGPLLRHFW